MKYIRWTTAWTLFWIGDALSRLPEWTHSKWYPAYNWCMCRSHDIQGPSEFGPWGAEKGKEGGQ